MELFCANIFLLIGYSQVVTSCTSGFMQLDVLRKRSEKISVGNTVASTGISEQMRVMYNQNLRFSCSGSITSLLLGVKVVTASDRRNSYPELLIYSNEPVFILFRRLHLKNSSKIRLTAGQFSSNGVFQYNLTTPIPFQSGNVLGVYQPPEAESVVQLFYVNDSTAPVAYTRSSKISTLTLISLISRKVSDQRMLLLPMTEPSGCLSAIFSTPEALRQKTVEVNINRVVVRDRQQRVFPDIHFTCNGSITKWIVGAGTRAGTSSSLSSEIQIWRRSGADSYTKVASTHLTAQSSINNSNVYEYVLSSPLGFQEGDILGVYQNEDSSVVPYYQESTGPQNLRHPDHLMSAPSTLVNPTTASAYDYPLVTVEIATDTKEEVRIVLTSRGLTTSGVTRTPPSMDSTDTKEEVSIVLTSRGLTTSGLTTRTPSMDSPTLNTLSSPMHGHSSESLNTTKSVSVYDGFTVLPSNHISNTVSTSSPASLSLATAVNVPIILQESIYESANSTLVVSSSKNANNLSKPSTLEESMPAIIGVVVLVLLLVATVIIIFAMIIVMIRWKRKRSNTHSFQHPVSTTNVGQDIAMKQNESYNATSFDMDIYQNETIHNTYEYVTPTTNGDQDCSFFNVSSSHGDHNSDQVIEVQQNVSYGASFLSTDSTEDVEDESCVYSYADLGPRYVVSKQL